MGWNRMGRRWLVVGLDGSLVRILGIVGIDGWIDPIPAVIFDSVGE